MGSSKMGSKPSGKRSVALRGGEKAFSRCLLGVEKRDLVFKFADRKSGEAGSFIKGRMGIYRDGLGNSLSGSKTLWNACARIVISTNSSGRGTTESGGAIVTQQPNLSSRHALAMNETDVILKVFMRSAAILRPSLPSCVQLRALDSGRSWEGSNGKQGK